MPVERVYDYYNLLMATPFFTTNRKRYSEFLRYFEHTWLGRRAPGRSNQPMFPLELWNCYELHLRRVPLTTNAVEGWHRGFQTLLGASHPSLWKLIEAFKKNDALQEVRQEQVDSGIAPAPTKAAYKDKQDRLFTVVSKFRLKEPLGYLRDIAQNLSF